MIRRLAVLGALLAACGPPAPRAVVVAGGALVVAAPDADTPPFDPGASRLASAARQLAAIAGHPVRFAIDAALADDTRRGFEAELADAVEAVARDLDALRRADPAAFAWAAPLVETVACRYDPAATRPSARLDEATRTVIVTEPAGSRALVAPSVVARALREAHAARAAARFANADPARIPAADRAAYFDWLVDAPQVNADDTGGPGLAEGRARRILAVIAIDRAATEADPALAARTRAWLLHEADTFVGRYLHHAAAVREAPAGGPFHEAERAWVAWVKRALPTMTDDEKLGVVKAAFVRGFNGAGYLPFAFPGLDPLALALDVVDAWARAGHPDGAARGRPSALHEHVVCPHPPDARGHRTRAPRCDHDLYRFALATDEGTRRLVDFAIARGDLAFVENLFVAVRFADRPDALGAALDLWARFSGHDPSWRVAARVIGDELAETSDRARLWADVRRAWRARPDRRGPLLFVLARSDPYDDGRAGWPRFADDFGAPVSAAELGAFLDVSPVALSRLPTIWPAIGRDVPRAQVIAPRLDAILDDPRADRPDRAVAAIGARLCAEGAAADLAALRRVVVARQARRPTEDLDFVVRALDPAPCARPARSTP